MHNESLQDTLDTILLRIRAGFPVIYLVTMEERRALNCLMKLFRVMRRESPQKHILRWGEGLGLEEVLVGPDPPGAFGDHVQAPYSWLDLEGFPPGALWHKRAGLLAAEALQQICGAGAGRGMMVNPALQDCLVVFFDLHRRISKDPCETCSELVRPLRTTAGELRDYYEAHRGEENAPYKTIIVVGPSADKLSDELEGDISVIDFPLPEKPELERVVRSMLDKEILTIPDPIPADHLCGVLGPPPEDADAAIEAERVASYRDRLTEMIANAGRGLTRDAFRLGLNGFAVRQRELKPSLIEGMLNIKADAVAKMPALEYTPHVDIQLGGLEDIKEWVDIRMGVVTSEEVRARYHLPAPKGVLLCGVAGGGKSQLAKYMAKAFNLALLRLDIGSLFGSYVGESERLTRNALQLAEALSPVVLWMDEIDKGFKGSGGDGGDGGVAARVFGYFLTWLAEKKDSVFVVATANDFKYLLGRFPEFGRKGRFDLIYWADLPSAEARRDIFKIYLQPLLCGDESVSRLLLDEAQIDKLAQTAGIVLPGGDLVDQYCTLLGHDRISPFMTGAEIEAAVNDAKIVAFTQERIKGDTGDVTAEVLYDVVREASSKALYNANAEDARKLESLRGLARAKGWMGADYRGDLTGRTEGESEAETGDSPALDAPKAEQRVANYD